MKSLSGRIDVSSPGLRTLPPTPPTPPPGPDDEWTPADLLKHFNADCLAWRLKASYGFLHKKSSPNDLAALNFKYLDMISALLHLFFSSTPADLRWGGWGDRRPQLRFSCSRLTKLNFFPADGYMVIRQWVGDGALGRWRRFPSTSPLERRVPERRSARWCAINQSIPGDEGGSC